MSERSLANVVAHERDLEIRIRALEAETQRLNRRVEQTRHPVHDCERWVVRAESFDDCLNRIMDRAEASA